MKVMPSEISSGGSASVEEPESEVLLTSDTYAVSSTVELSPEVEEFWEVGKVAQAPTLMEQIANIEEDSTARRNIIRAKPSVLARSPLLSHHVRTRRSFSEREGLEDLVAFLDTVEETAGAQEDDASAQILEHARSFRENFSFLGEQELETACEGLAHIWAEYIQQDSEHILNVMRPEHAKSFQFIFDRVMKRVAELVPDTAVLGRIRLAPEAWVDTDAAKLIVLDDWAITSATMEKLVQHAVIRAESVGANGLLSKIEGHVLIARKGQVEKVGSNNQPPFRLRTFYETDAEDQGPFAVTVSGAHSSVDYGFESAFVEFGQYLDRQGKGREYPLLTHIDRPYNPELPNTPAIEAFLEHFADTNRQVFEVGTVIAELEEEIRDLTDYNDPRRKGLEERFEELTERRLRLLSQQREAFDEYDRLYREQQK